MVRIILDTGVFYRPQALADLRDAPEDVIVPAVALAERVRQLNRDARSEKLFFDGLEASDFTLEALDPHHACEVARKITSDAAWARLARDAFIAAHVRPGDTIWTTNPRDFRELGVPEEAIVAIA